MRHEQARQLNRSLRRELFATLVALALIALVKAGWVAW